MIKCCTRHMVTFQFATLVLATLTATPVYSYFMDTPHVVRSEYRACHNNNREAEHWPFGTVATFLYFVNTPFNRSLLTYPHHAQCESTASCSCDRLTLFLLNLAGHRSPPSSLHECTSARSMGETRQRVSARSVSHFCRKCSRCSMKKEGYLQAPDDLPKPGIGPYLVLPR